MVYLMALLELYNTYEHGEAFHHVAGCFLENIHRIGDMSVGELADMCSVSKATITRFFRKMSFPPASGMSHVLHSIEDARVFEGSFMPGEAGAGDTMSAYACSLKAAIDGLSETLASTVLEAAAQGLQRAKQVHFFAVPMVLDVFLLQGELVMAGKRTTAYLNPEHQEEAIDRLDEDSAAVIIHQCRQPDSYLDRVLQAAQDRGSSTLVISNNPQIQICKAADWCLAFKGSHSLQDSMLCNIVLHMLGAAFRKAEWEVQQ